MVQALSRNKQLSRFIWVVAHGKFDYVLEGQYRTLLKKHLLHDLKTSDRAQTIKMPYCRSFYNFVATKQKQQKTVFL